MSPTILSNPIPSPMVNEKPNPDFLSGVEILIPHISLIVSQQTSMSSKVGDPF